ARARRARRVVAGRARLPFVTRGTRIEAGGERENERQRKQAKRRHCRSMALPRITLMPLVALDAVELTRVVRRALAGLGAEDPTQGLRDQAAAVEAGVPPRAIEVALAGAPDGRGVLRD